MVHIVDLATRAAREPVERVGTVYALLGVVFGTPQLLLELAATGDPWYVVVNQLAAEAATFYGGREAVHLPDSAFDPASVPGQGSDPGPGLLAGRSSSTGPGSTSSGCTWSRPGATRSMRCATSGCRVRGRPRSPERPRTSAALTNLLPSSSSEPMGWAPTGRQGSWMSPRAAASSSTRTARARASSPTPRRCGRLADLRYAVLLGVLERYLLAPVDDRAFLRGWCFAEMFALSKLAEFLIQLPRGVSAPPQVAALPFTVPGWLATGGGWPDLAAAFDESMTIARPADRGRCGLRPAPPVLLLASDERKLREATARATGTSVRTRTDAVRDVLDWGGRRRPSAPLGRLARTAEERAKPVLEPAARRLRPGGDLWGERHDPPPHPEDAPLIDMLRTGFMPKGRPRLAEESEEFRLVERWVADGCPDDTI